MDVQQLNKINIKLKKKVRQIYAFWVHVTRPIGVPLI